jgi:peptidoglycan/LPS O-acetylase OafA/YrhL
VPHPRKDNSFNLLRLGAALWVFLSHEQLMTSVAWKPQGELGVYVFFSISGFLIARSWDRRHSVLEYLRNRCLRILPALWTVILVCTFIIGPLASNLPAARYFASPQTWRYLLNGVFDLQLTLPGVFNDLPYPLINTPLWTLLHEALYYVALVPLGLLFGKHLRVFLLGTWVLLLGSQLMHVGNQTPIELIGYFIGGALIGQYRESIRMHWSLLLLAVAGLVFQYAVRTGGVLPILCLPYAVIWLGLRKPLSALRHFTKNDYSYGLYVWGMPTQECVAHFACISAFWPHVLLSLFAAALCAAASWFLIERRALNLKTSEANSADQGRGNGVPPGAEGESSLAAL